jgi:hypothetical protein
MAKQDWHLDKKVQITTFIIYTGTAIWFAGRLDSRVGTIESRQAMGVTAFERLVKLETNQDNLKETLKDALSEMRTSINKIDANVQKLADKK